MSTTIPSHYLVRINPAQNMARFYAISIEPSLFGEILLMRRWGRIGTFGRMATEAYSTLDEAADASQRYADLKRRRGYCQSTQ